jgi:uncharacterized membrane-anchored protein YhcB (DUF1043 family)
MPWTYAIIGLIIGTIIGIVISRITTPQYQKQKEMQKELETSRFELEQQKQELSDHFSQTAELLDEIGKDYTKLYQHMAKTSSEMLPSLPEQDNPFKKLTQSEEVNAPDTIEIPPKDYAKGATGMLKETEKEIIEAPDAIKAS